MRKLRHKQKNKIVQITQWELTKLYVSIYGSLVLMFLGVMGLYIQATGNNAEARNNLQEASQQSDITICDRQNALRNEIRLFITKAYRHSLTQLEQIAYYQEHPEEMAEARANIRTNIVQVNKNFKRIPCTKIATIGEGNG